MYLTNRMKNKFKKWGLRAVKEGSIKVDTLNLWCLVKNVSMPIRDGYHMQALQVLKKGYCEEELRKTEYYKMFKIWHSDKRIFGDLKKFIALYNAIRKGGFKKKACKKHPICVLEKPFYETRFGKSESFYGPELWTGLHRCTICCDLSIKSVPCIWLEDILPNTKECGPLKEKYDGEYLCS